MKTVLVTGAAGFIGRHTLTPLLDFGYKVITTGRSTLPVDSRVEHHCADLLDKNQIATLIKETRPEELLHLAWYLEPGKYLHSFLNDAWLAASRELLKQFGLHGGKRAVLAGTCFEYQFQDSLLDELESPVDGNSHYGECKNALRIEAEKLSNDFQFSLAWARIFYLYGPHEYENRLVASVINSLIKSKEAPCSEGTQIRDYLHVQDVADGLSHILQSNITGPVNVTDGVGHTIRQIVETIADLTGRPELVKFGAFQPRPGDPDLVVGAPGKILTTPWKPSFDLTSGLRATIEWWKQAHQGNSVPIKN